MQRGFEHKVEEIWTRSYPMQEHIHVGQAAPFDTEGDKAALGIALAGATGMKPDEGYMADLKSASYFAVRLQTYFIQTYQRFKYLDIPKEENTADDPGSESGSESDGQQGPKGLSAGTTWQGTSLQDKSPRFHPYRNYTSCNELLGI